MKQEAQELMKEITAILWHMRGGITREEAWVLSQRERAAIISDINNRVQQAKESGVPIL